MALKTNKEPCIIDNIRCYACMHAHYMLKKRTQKKKEKKNVFLFLFPSVCGSVFVWGFFFFTCNIHCILKWL